MNSTRQLSMIPSGLFRKLSPSGRAAISRPTSSALVEDGSRRFASSIIPTPPQNIFATPVNRNRPQQQVVWFSSQNESSSTSTSTATTTTRTRTKTTDKLGADDTDGPSDADQILQGISVQEADIEPNYDTMQPESSLEAGDRSLYTIPITIHMPDVNDESDDNIVEEWFKAPGDIIQRNDVLCDITTPDFTFGMMTEDNEDAIMGEIHVQAGQEAEDGVPICTIYHQAQEKPTNVEKSDDEASKDEESSKK